MTQTFSHTEAGGHAHNEDAFEVQPHPSDADCLLVVLADGQGGHAGGARAAWVACRAAVEAASAHPPARLTPRPDAWEAIVRTADAAVAADPDAGFTTLIAFAIHKDFLCGASNGDGGLLAVSAGRPAVVLTARQHKDPPVGCGGARPAGFAARLVRPWAVLALSDGVWKYAGWDEVSWAASQRRGDEILLGLRRPARRRPVARRFHARRSARRWDDRLLHVVRVNQIIGEPHEAMRTLVGHMGIHPRHGPFR